MRVIRKMITMITKIDMKMPTDTPAPKMSPMASQEVNMKLQNRTEKIAKKFFMSLIVELTLNGVCLCVLKG